MLSCSLLSGYNIPNWHLFLSKESILVSTSQVNTLICPISSKLFTA